MISTPGGDIETLYSIGPIAKEIYLKKHKFIVAEFNDS